jgi:hypothetical protein
MSSSPLLRALPTAALSLLAACGDNLERLGPDAAPAPVRAVLTTGDFNVTGVLASLALPSMQMVPDAVSGVVSGDPVVRRHDRELFIVNRGNTSNITILDADSLQLIGEQIATGVGTNPQDVAVVGRKLYVPLYGDTFSPTGVPGKGVAVFDRDRPGWRADIDLSSLDPDGAPDCISAYAIGTEVYVVCGLLGPFSAPVRDARIAVIDATRDAMVTSVSLGAQNPLGLIERSPMGSAYGGDFLMPTVPSFTDYGVGCVARVKIEASGLSPNGCAISNQDLGGYANRVEASVDGSQLWIAAVGYQDADFTKPYGRLVPLDLATGALGTAVTPPAQVITDVATCPGGWVVASDATAGAGGLRVYKDGSVGSLLVAGRPPNGVPHNLVCF